MPDSETYSKKKAFLDGMLTIYGRKPVLEALGLEEVQPYRLHLARDNRPSSILNEIINLAGHKDVGIEYHDRQGLSRLSKNKRQDQGVVLDIVAPQYKPVSSLEIAQLQNRSCSDLIALENVTNPQNVGMMIRSVGASPCAGIIIPSHGCAKIDAMVIKASAGAALKVPIYYVSEAYSGLKSLKQQGFRLMGLSSYGKLSLADVDHRIPTVFVLGNESKGLTTQMARLCDQQVQIPLQNNVESLNVTVAASIVAFRSIF